MLRPSSSARIHRFFFTGLAGIVVLWGLGAGTPVHAQEMEPDTSGYGPDPYGSGAGLEVLLTNSGFGLGGYYRRAVTPRASFFLEASMGSGKDEREVKFFSRWTSYIPNKANYLIMLPIHLGVQRRLFREHIEDNFRPYLQISGGPTLGWEYPYFDDCNGNEKYDDISSCGKNGSEKIYNSISAIPKGKFQFGVGGMIALGAHFGKSRKMTQGVRVGYGFSYFFNDIVLLEPDVPGGMQKYFGSPTITLTFGKIY